MQVLESTWRSIVGKNVTIRLEEHELRAAQGLALVFETNLSTVLRQAIAHYVENAREAPGFEQRVAEARERQSEVFNLLVGATGMGVPSEPGRVGPLPAVVPEPRHS